jgi:hypothetical protein
MNQEITPIYTAYMSTSGTSGDGNIPNSYLYPGLISFTLFTVVFLTTSFFVLRDEYKKDSLDEEDLFTYPLVSILGSALAALLWPLAWAVIIFVGIFSYFKPKQEEKPEWHSLDLSSPNYTSPFYTQVQQLKDDENDA